MTELDDFQKAQAAEYGKYVAKDVIYVNGVRAFNAGDPVPVSHVESGVVNAEQVLGTNTKAAAAVVSKEN